MTGHETDGAHSLAGDAFTEVLDGRSIRYLYDIGGRSVHLSCRVRGKVTWSRGMKNVLFMALDTTDDLQLVFDRAVLGDDQLADATGRLRVGGRVEVSVETEYADGRKPPIRLIVQHFTPLPANPIAVRRSEVSHDQAYGRIELASIARAAADYLTTMGWVEAAPLTISTNLDQSMDPLQLVFPGLGAETSLVVSPLAELVEIAQLTGNRSIYSVSRLYSRAVRDGFTSPESLAVVAVRLLERDIKEPDLALAQALVANALQPVKNRLSDRGRHWLTSNWERRTSTTLGPMQEISAPLHQMLRNGDTVAFRSLWPHPISLVEGHIRQLQDGCLECVTLHCERVLHLVSGLHYRRLQEGPQFTQQAFEK